MRISEIAPEHYENVAGVLMTVLQHLDSKTADGTVVPFESIAELMSNMGYSLNYKSFSDLMDNVPELGNIVTNYNEKSITLGKSDSIETGNGEQDSDAVVDRMAKNATKDAI